MRIGIDIDDVITNTSETMQEYVSRYKNNEKLKKHMVEIMKGTPSEPEVIQFCLDNYIKIFREVKAKENAKEVIERLLNNGNEIYLITARGEEAKFFKGSEEITKTFLEKNKINYNKIIFNGIDKAKICKDNCIDVMIDDSIAHCEDVRKSGIKSIVFNSQVNISIPTTIERVNDWIELEEKIMKFEK